MVERKCSNCGTWNTTEDYCKNCGAAVSPAAVNKEKIRKREEEEANKEPSNFDLFLERMKTSKYLLVRMAYKVMYGITMVAGAIGAFFAWMVAMANG
jgi:methionyl-tRNA synthetase